MQLNLKKPLAFFDIESTGINIAHDRIVEICFVKAIPGGELITKTMRINPTIPIPLESSLIHGIYDNDVATAPPFKSLAKSMAKFLEGCDLAGYNIIRFDVPLLVEEFLRAGVNFDITNRKLIDAQKIFHMMEKRTLSAAYKYYCNKELDGAHNAEVDTVATYEVLKAQVEKYQGQEVTDSLGKHLGIINNDMETLHKVTATGMVDLAGRFCLNNDGVEVFNFGKHKGKPISLILKKEPSYYEWMMNGDFPLDTKRKLTEIKLRDFNK
ncbi:MAG: 3'-5' exonuclease [Bacteroidota bacterium]|nr:3'-5' exonuclease [Bacteroidota bacterium]